MHRALVCGGVLPLVFACSSGEVDSGSASTSASGAASASGSGDASESGDSDATETDGNTEGSGASGGTGETGSSRGVDLALTSIELAPSSPAVGDGVWISASLKNHGADGLDLPVRLGFAIDGVPQVALGREVVGLGAGQEIEMRAAVAWIPEEGGVVEVAAVVDADADARRARRGGQFHGRGGERRRWRGQALPDDRRGDGALSEWVAQVSLPSPQIDLNWGDGHTEGPAYGLIGGHVYVMGPKRVYTARLKASVCDRGVPDGRSFWAQPHSARMYARISATSWSLRLARKAGIASSPSRMTVTISPSDSCFACSARLG